jgi:hypothetical protein
MTVYVYRLAANSPDSRAHDLLTICMYASSSRLQIDNFFEENEEWKSVEWPPRPQARALLAIVESGDTIIGLAWEDIFISDNARGLFIDLKNRGIRLEIVTLNGDVFRYPMEHYANRFDDLATTGAR